MKLIERIALNTVTIYSAKLIECILQFIIIGYILKTLGKELFGVALLFISIQASIEILRLCLGKATIKYMAEYLANGNKHEAQNIFSTSFFLQSLFGLFGFLVCLGIAPFITILLNIPIDLKETGTISVLIIGISIFCNSIMTPWQFAIMSHERYDLSSISLLCGKLLRAVLIFILLTIQPSFVCIILATVLGVLFERFLNYLFLRKLDPSLVFKLKFTSRPHFKKIFNFSFFELFHTLSNILYRQGTLYMAAHLISLNAVSDFGIVFTITQFVRVIVMQFAVMFVPITSRLKAFGKKDEIVFLLKNSTLTCVVLGGIILTAIIPWMESILGLWIGPSYASLIDFITILLIGEFLFCSIGSIHATLGGTGNIKLDGINNLSATLFGLLFGCILVVFFDLNFLGIVIGLFSSMLIRFFSITIYGAVLFKINYLNFFYNCYLKVFGFICLVIFCANQLNMTFVHWQTLLPACLFTALFFLTLCVLFVIPKEVLVLFSKTKSGSA